MNRIKKVLYFVKESLKERLGIERYLIYYLKYRKFIGAYYILTSDLNRVLVRRLFRRKGGSKQQFLTWETNLSLGSSFQDLLTYLADNHVVYLEGTFSIYLPPQPDLARHLGAFVDFYPDDAGYKIVKDFAAPDKANYVRNGVTVSWQESVLVGDPNQQVIAANTAEVLGLGSRLYDLAALEAGQTVVTCFVVRHIESQPVAGEDVARFIAQLNHVVQQGILGTAVPYKGSHKDFNPPNCNGNLVKDAEGALRYVDFQQFVVMDGQGVIRQKLTENAARLSFGVVHPLRKNDYYLYQTIPGVDLVGRRDSQLRWGWIKKLLAEAELTVDRRVILDVCCNSGVMSALALSEGALWALGWDLPEVAGTAQEVQRLLGFTRMDLTKASLSKDYSLMADIPARFQPFLDEAVVFYLAAWNHIGFVTELARMPWRALVFEGHERIDRQGYAELIEIMERQCHSALIADTMLHDGDSEPRWLGVFVRS